MRQVLLPFQPPPPVPPSLSHLQVQGSHLGSLSLIISLNDNLVARCPQIRAGL